MSIKHAERGTRKVSLYVEDDAQSPPPTASASDEEPWFPLTGDVVLFSVDKKSLPSSLISLLTGSEWTHAAMLCTSLHPANRAPESPEADEGTDGRCWRTVTGERLLLMESTSGLAEKKMWDFVTGTRRNGIRVVDAYQRLRQRCVDEKCRAILRRVRPLTPNVADNLASAIAFVQLKYQNGEYELNPFFLSEAAIRPPAVFSPEKEAALARRTRAFCSQIVAEVLMTAGLLPADRSALTYAPADFAPGGSAEQALARKGFGLSEAREIQFPKE